MLTKRECGRNRNVNEMGMLTCGNMEEVGEGLEYGRK